MSQAAQPPRESDLERVERLMQEKGITGKVEPRKNRKNKFYPDLFAWKVILFYEGRRLTSYVYTSYDQPTLAFAFNAMLQDTAHIFDGTSYEQWCNEYRLDPNEDETRERYEQCDILAGKIRTFLSQSVRVSEVLMDLFLYGEH